jgi:aspartyl-tRNA(Asn)/glutamyl-tRNA(Gln) amidotransferase subunit A
MTREVDAVLRDVDVLVTAAPGPAPRLDVWRPANFWRQHASLVAAFNVTGGPALVQCIGLADGLPLSMQIAGRAFDEATVLRVAHAYEHATAWRSRRPPLMPGATPLPLPPVPDPEASALSTAEEAELAQLCARAGIHPGERAFRHLCSVAPHVRETLDRLHRTADFAQEPACVVRMN